jgi:hypothetical protein
MVSLPEDDAIRASVRPDRGREARAYAWAFVFQCWQDKQKNVEPAPEPDVRDDVKESHGYVATKDINR